MDDLEQIGTLLQGEEYGRAFRAVETAPPEKLDSAWVSGLLGALPLSPPEDGRQEAVPEDRVWKLLDAVAERTGQQTERWWTDRAGDFRKLGRTREEVRSLLAARKLAADPGEVDRALDRVAPFPWPTGYPKEAEMALNGTIRQRFGPEPVFRKEETVGRTVLLAVFPPREGELWRTAVTLNVGALPMQAPAQRADCLKRVELVVRLPKGEDRSSTWKKAVTAAAKAVMEFRDQGYWLMHGTVVPVSRAVNSFSAFLVEPLREQEGRCPMSAGEEISLLEAFWLFPDEQRFCSSDQAGKEVWNRLQKVAVAADPGRKCVCPEVLSRKEEKSILRQTGGESRITYGMLYSMQSLYDTQESKRTYAMNLQMSRFQDSWAGLVDFGFLAQTTLESMECTAQLDPEWMYLYGRAIMKQGSKQEALFWLNRARDHGVEEKDLEQKIRECRMVVEQIPRHISCLLRREQKELKERLSQRFGYLSHVTVVGHATAGRTDDTEVTVLGFGANQKCPWSGLVTCGLSQAELPAPGRDGETERVELVLTRPAILPVEGEWSMRELDRCCVNFLEGLLSWSLNGKGICTGVLYSCGNDSPQSTFHGMCIVPLPEELGEKKMVLSSGRQITLYRILPVFEEEMPLLKDDRAREAFAQLSRVEPGLELVRPLIPAVRGGA